MHAWTGSTSIVGRLSSAAVSGIEEHLARSDLAVDACCQIGPGATQCLSGRYPAAPYVEGLPLEQRLGLDALLQSFVRRQDRRVDLPVVQQQIQK